MSSARYRLALGVLGAIFVGALVPSCGDSSDGFALLVDLRTDYRPGVDFSEVEVTVIESGSTAETRSTTPATMRDDFAAGERVAELRDLSPGSTRVRARLRSASGATVAERSILIELAATRGVTLVITRSCAAISCPEVGGDADARECFAGRCVPSTCVAPPDPSCGVPECDADGDCPAVGCMVGRCAAEACFALTNDAVCTAGLHCEPGGTCVASELDAGSATDGGDAMDDASMMMADAGALDDGAVGVSDGGCTCPSPLMCCVGLCVPSDEMNCNACGVTCRDATPTCCSEGCIDTQNDRANCGACRASCAPFQGCVQGHCCPATHSWCDSCVNLTTDTANCGACGRRCADGERCEAGVCVS